MLSPPSSVSAITTAVGSSASKRSIFSVVTVRTSEIFSRLRSNAFTLFFAFLVLFFSFSSWSWSVATSAASCGEETV